MASCGVPTFGFQNTVELSSELCADGKQSGSETDVDCGGGACSACASGLHCLAGRDCASLACLSGSCAQPSCSDELRNGEEGDVDCGGPCSSCLPGQSCKLATDCAGGNCTSGICSLTCLDGKGNCDGDPANGCEANLKADPAHCGACETPCNLPHAVASCNGGSCAVSSCAAPFADCDGDPTNGCETNTSTDANSCAGCGLACAAVNGVPSCVASACQIVCATGYADCDDDRANGCEKKVDSDASNCGACGKVCAAGNGTPRCNDGVCGVSDCPAGFGDCDGDPKNGCEVDLTSDAQNCKICGSACPFANNSPSCVASACTIGSCDANHADCNGALKDGCETNVVSDPSNCGACGKVCAIGNATAKCEAKQCKVSACNAPWADCDKNGTDCETNTSSNGANCGGCGANGLNCNTVYGALNATGKCSASGCQLDKCAANFGDCNGNPDADGCEANLKTASNNCGACGSVCQAPHGSNSCAAGACSPSCGASFADCDGSVKSGCEVVLDNDVNNCGGCGTVCQQTNASNVCAGGACSATCSQSYFQSCDGNDDNGCEVDTRSSKSHCGACGKACADNQTSSNNCASGVCQPMCLTNRADCDGNPNNGCETPTASDAANCGGCDVQCKLQNASATTCSGGACAPTCNSGFGACSNAAAGCTTSLDTAAHCGNCATSCTGGTPFCVSRACKAHLDIAVVNANTVGISTSTGLNLSLSHALQTAAAANAYRLVVVGVTGFGSGTGSLPLSVRYNNVDMTLAKSFASTGQVGSAIYYIQGADLPMNAGPYNVLVSAAGSNTYVLAANVLELINVEQSSGALDAVGGQASGTCAGHMPSDTVTVATSGEYIYSVLSVIGQTNDASPNPSGQTVTEQSGIASLGSIAGYLKSTATGSRPITWSIANCTASAHTLISLKPALTP